MITWLTRKQQLDLLAAKLTETVKNGKPLNEQRKKLMKQRVLMRINEAMAREEIGFEQLAAQLEKLTLKVQPSAAFKQHTRQNLVDLVTLREQRLWIKDIFNELLARRRMWATVTACTVLVTSVFGYFIQTPRVSAAKVSQMDAIRGTVYVDRNGEQLPVQNGFLVKEGDRLVTLGDSFADVMFVDDSLITLGPDTDLTIGELWVDSANEANTSIEIDLDQGQVFTQVVNLSPNASLFKIRTDEGLFSVDRKAHFDVKVADDQTNVRVFANLVDFEVVSEGVKREGTLSPNLKLEVNGDLVIEGIENLDDLKNNDVWVKTNLESHSAYLNRLQDFYLTRAEQEAGSLPGDSLYFLEKGGEEVKKLLSFSDRAKVETNLAMANQRFSEAAVLMRQGRTDESNQLLSDYQNMIVDLATEVPDQEQALKAVLQKNRKMIEGLPLDDGVRAARALVDETEVLVVSDEAEKKVTHLETTADRLGLALDLIQIGAYDLAGQSLGDYQIGLSDVLDGLGDLPMETRKQVVLEILDQKLRDLLMLKMILNELSAVSEEVDVEALKEQVASLYSDTLYQLNTLVINLKDRAVLQLGTFLKDTKGEENMQRDILSRLKKTVPLDLEYMQVINDLEAFYENEDSTVLVLGVDRLVPSGKESTPLLENYRETPMPQTGTELDGEARI